MRTVASAIAVTLAGVLGIAVVQPRLFQRAKVVKQQGDVFLLPPPTELHAMTFGYDAAAADLVWAKLLLEYGVHWQEKRTFPDIRRFVDAIVELDPSHPTLYRFVDAILVYQPTETNKSQGTADDARDARKYLERGLEAHPFDADLWLHYGQFLAFTGKDFLPDPAEQAAWRRAGATGIARAMELGAPVDKTLAASSILGATGEREASIRYLERAWALADDDVTKDYVLGQLRKVRASSEAAEAEKTGRRFERAWQRSYPFLTRSQFTLLGPMPDPAACAGHRAALTLDCARTWPEAFAGR